MLVHSVFFWLKPDLTPAQRAKFRSAVEGLAKIESIAQIHVGAPAATEDRGVIERGYSVALTTLFKDMAAHDIYQVHPLHVKFIEDFNTYWTKVLIFDAE